MNAPRSASAPITPASSTRRWQAAGTAKAWKSSAKTNRLSTLSACSVRYAAKYCWPASPPSVATMTIPNPAPTATQAAVSAADRENPGGRRVASRSMTSRQPIVPAVAAQAQPGTVIIGGHGAAAGPRVAGSAGGSRSRRDRFRRSTTEPARAGRRSSTFASFARVGSFPRRCHQQSAPRRTARRAAVVLAWSDGPAGATGGAAGAAAESSP